LLASKNSFSILLFIIFLLAIVILLFSCAFIL
jgi:hypothetical protein